VTGEAVRQREGEGRWEPVSARCGSRRSHKTARDNGRLGAPGVVSALRDCFGRPSSSRGCLGRRAPRGHLFFAFSRPPEPPVLERRCGRPRPGDACIRKGWQKSRPEGERGLGGARRTDRLSGRLFPEAGPPSGGGLETKESRPRETWLDASRCGVAARRADPSDCRSGGENGPPVSWRR